MDGRKGRYVMIEGPDGAGKTTITERLKNENFSLPVFAIREPGTGEFGEHIRKTFREFPDLHASVKFNLMFSVRSFLAQEIAEKRWNHLVVSDRGFPSTFAYQISAEREEKLTSAFWTLLASRKVLMPDLIILLDADVKVATERMKTERGDVAIKEFDDASFDFKELVRAGYLRFASAVNGDHAGYEYWLHRQKLKWLLDEMGLKLPKVVILDTTNTTTDEAYGVVLRIIGQELGILRTFDINRS